ncbi:MFS transporter [bacterium]|nr:MFS transporter [bacterium]
MRLGYRSCQEENRLHQDLRWITREGGTFCVMSGSALEFLPAYVLALSKSALASGQIGTIPMFVGAVLQNLAPGALRWVASVRLWSMFMATFQGLVLLALAVGSTLGHLPLWSVFTLVSLYWAAAWSVGPAWNTWMDSIVPARVRATYFSRRTALCNLVQWGTMMAASWLLARGQHLGITVPIFASLFAIAGCARLVGVYCYARQSEPVPLPANYSVLGFRQALEKIRKTPKARPLLYLLGGQFALRLAEPFVYAFLVQSKGLSYGAAALCLAAGTICKVTFMPQLGKRADNLGASSLYRGAGLGLAAISLLWLLPIKHLAFCIAVQGCAGACTAAFELANMLVYLEAVPAADRASVLARFAIFNNAAGLLGSALGGAVLTLLPGNYSALFALAALARVAALKLLPAATVSVAPKRVAQKRRRPEDLAQRLVKPYRARRRSLRLEVGAARRQVVSPQP